MNIFERIVEDHEAQRQMMASLVQTEGDSQQRRDLFNNLFSEYNAHAAAEEQILYAVLLEEPAGTDKARHSVAEHQETIKLLEELRDTDMNSSGWLQKMKKVQHDNDHHMEEEENEVFPHARKVLKDADLDKMGVAFSKRKTQELLAT